jgi:hypothetical protein
LTLITEEDLRHRAEVRQVLKWRVESRSKAVEYLALVRKKRGDSKADMLEKDCKDQWSKGNRGDIGVWIE